MKKLKKITFSVIEKGLNSNEMSELRGGDYTAPPVTTYTVSTNTCTSNPNPPTVPPRSC